MKIGSKISFLMIIPLFLVSCIGDSKIKFEDIRSKLDKLDLSKIINLNATVRSRDNNDIRIIVTESNDLEKGMILFKINNDLKILESNYSRWNSKDTLEYESAELIFTLLCEVGLYSIEVDSCKNLYFSTSVSDNFEFIKIQDKSCISSKYIIGKFSKDYYSLKIK